MMKIFIILCLITIILFPLVHAYASPRDAELVLENMSIEPFYSKKGDFVTINADVYNAGLKNTNLFTSIITVAYFIDGKLIHIDDLGNVTPGVQNKMKITSSPISKTELENHEIKIILDYHNTLNDKYDSSIDNILKKSFFVDELLHTTLSLDIFPTYVVEDNRMPRFVVSLIDSNTSVPLINKKIVLILDDNTLNLTTNKEGKISISNTVVSYGSVNVEAYFEGDAKYSPSNSSSTLYSFSKEMNSSLIITILDFQNKYNFENYLFDVLIFEDSYDNLIKKVQPDSATLLDSKTFLIPLPPDHNYFTEIYLDGRLFSVTDKGLLKKNSILGNELEIPELATIKFEVVDNTNLPITGMSIKNWIYSVPVENGSTDWIDVLPTKYDKPYVAELFLDDQKITQSDPFLLFSGEKKTIPIIISDSSSNFKIPPWIKNNAGWWANGKIDDNSFVRGIQFLIQKGILNMP